jgi:hypothetical protein
MNPSRIATLFTIVLLLALPVFAQGTLADYERAQSLRKQFDGAVVNIAGRATWIEGTHTFWYRRSSRGGNEFILFNADTLAKTPLFDQTKLAASLSTAAGENYKPLELPFSMFTFVSNGTAIQFTIGENSFRCDLNNYNCARWQMGGLPKELQSLYPGQR